MSDESKTQTESLKQPLPKLSVSKLVWSKIISNEIGMDNSKIFCNKTICTILLPVNTLFFISDSSYCALLLLEEDPLIFSDISTTSNLVPSSKHPSNELTFFPATIVLQYSLSLSLSLCFLSRLISGKTLSENAAKTHHFLLDWLN